MALHGKSASVFINLTAASSGTVKLGESTNWSISGSQANVAAPRHGDNWTFKVAGLRDWTATMDVLLNLELTANQSILADQAFFAALPTKVYTEFRTGAGSLHGNAFIESYAPSAPANDIQTVSFGITGVGTLTKVP